MPAIFPISVKQDSASAYPILKTLAAHLHLRELRPGEFEAFLPNEEVEIAEALAATTAILDRLHPDWRAHIEISLSSSCDG